MKGLIAGGPMNLTNTTETAPYRPNGRSATAKRRGAVLARSFLEGVVSAQSTSRLHAGSELTLKRLGALSLRRLGDPSRSDTGGRCSVPFDHLAGDIGIDGARGLRRAEHDKLGHAGAFELADLLDEFVRRCDKLGGSADHLGRYERPFLGQQIGAMAPLKGVGLRVSVFGTNLTNEKYAINGLAQGVNGGITTGIVREPRVYGVGLRYAFGVE
jgi:hypothetical protein